MKKLLFILLLLPLFAFPQAEKRYRSIIVDSLKALNGGRVDVKDTLLLDSLAVYNTDLSSQYTSRSLVDSAFIGSAIIVSASDSSFITLQVDTIKLFNNNTIQFSDTIGVQSIQVNSASEPAAIVDANSNIQFDFNIFATDDLIITSDNGLAFEGYVFIDQTAAEIGFGDFNTPANGLASFLVVSNEARMTVNGFVVFRVGAAAVGFYGALPVAKAGATNDLKDSFISLGLITGAGATPLNLDGGAATVGTLTATAAVIFSGTEDIAAGGTTTPLSRVISQHKIGADAGGDIFTLANGSVGEIHTIALDDATGIATITPATFNGGTSITFNALGDSVTLQWFATIGWTIIGGNSFTII